MSALALGIACDLYVVVQKATGAIATGILAAAAWLFVSLATWLVYCARGRVLRVSDA
jgi:hypothetical protein